MGLRSARFSSFTVPVPAPHRDELRGARAEGGAGGGRPAGSLFKDVLLKKCLKNRIEKPGLGAFFSSYGAAGSAGPVRSGQWSGPSRPWAGPVPRARWLASARVATWRPATIGTLTFPPPRGARLPSRAAVGGARWRRRRRRCAASFPPTRRASRPQGRPRKRRGRGQRPGTHRLPRSPPRRGPRAALSRRRREAWPARPAGGGHGLGGGIQGAQGRLPLRLLRLRGGQGVLR